MVKMHVKEILLCSHTPTDGRLCSQQVVLRRVPHELLVHGEPEGRLDAQTALHVPHSQLHPTHGHNRHMQRRTATTQLLFHDGPPASSC